MASVGPTPPPGWYADPRSPGQQRYWDGANWTAQTSPAAPPPPAYGGQPWGQGASQPAPGGMVTSMFPPRPGESPDDALTRGFASYQRISGYVWLAIGIIQVVLLITIIAGIWNIYVGINRGKLASRIERRDPSIPATFEPLAGYIVSGVLNFLLGGVLGVALVACDLYVRDQLLRSRRLFGALPAANSGFPSPPMNGTPGYAPGAPYGYDPGTPPTMNGPQF